MPKGKCRQRFDKRGDVEWTCGDCLTLEEGYYILYLPGLRPDAADPDN